MLRPVAEKWKVIGVALKLSEDFLDAQLHIDFAFHVEK